MAAVRSCVACCRCSVLLRTLTTRKVGPKLVSSFNYGITRRAFSTEPLPLPSEDKSAAPHIEQLVDSISKLTLLEVSSLNELLKKRLNIQDTAMMMAGPAVAAAPADLEDEEPVKEEQTEFAVKLLSFDTTKKVKLIKEIKVVMTDMNLVQAKKFVESTPQLVKEKLSKEDADKLKAQLETVGATVEIE